MVDSTEGVDLSAAHQVSKIVVPILLFALTFLSGVVPILIVKRLKTAAHAGQTHESKVISFVACLGGGVLFATALLHIIPDVRRNFEELSHHSNESHHEHHEHHEHHDHYEYDEDHGGHHGHNHAEFPLTEFVVCIGFLSVYLVEEIVQACLGHKSHVNEDHGHSHSPQVIQCATTGEQANNQISEPYRFNVFEQVEGGHSHALPDDVSSVSVAGILTVAALSFHSIFEGLTVGIQASVFKTWLMLLAILFHKLVISFVLGFELCVSGAKKKDMPLDIPSKAVIIYIMLFSLMSPIGAYVGLLAQSFLSENFALEGVLNGIAAGTLLYVTFFEVLQKQKNTSLHGVLQLTAVVLGFGVMLGLQRLVAFVEVQAEAHHA